MLQQKNNRKLNQTLIVHISDTHLGFKSYHYHNDKTSLNQREQDNYECFKAAIEKILKIKPAYVLHAGDLFDTVRPSNYTLDFAISKLNKLASAGIKVILLSGNHCMPKIKDQSHIFKIFRHFNNIFPLYKGIYEQLEFENIRIHALSQTLNDKTYQEELKKINRIKLTNDKKNILLLHGAVNTIKEFSMNEFNELNIDPKVFKKDFDYIALGHYHNKTRIEPNCYYSGSIMPLSFNEASNNKGFLLINIQTRDTQFIKIDSRPLIDLPVIDAYELDEEEIEKNIKYNLKKIGNKSICRQKMINTNIDTYKLINLKNIKEIKKCFHYQLVPSHNKDASEIQSSASILNLEVEFQKFLEKKDIKKDLNKLRELGLNYLTRHNEIN